ncbi:hypothetical protein MMC12_004270 [Toensbergia leucococca]|nr:hypothetical protein [Toensbergia leucococca]
MYSIYRSDLLCLLILSIKPIEPSSAFRPIHLQVRFRRQASIGCIERLSTWITCAEQYREELQHQPEEMLTEDSQSNNTITLPAERPYIFTIFVHWLYTHELITTNNCVELDMEDICISVYALAERLDVPLLRQECYCKIREWYKPPSKLPNAEAVCTVINECSDTSMLRKYFVRLFAHAVISQSIDEKDNPALDLYPEFSAEVANEIMLRLRAGGQTHSPYGDENFESDDSDSDFMSLESESMTDSDCAMDTSDDEDLDPLFADQSEDKEKATVDIVGMPVVGELAELRLDDNGVGEEKAVKSTEGHDDKRGGNRGEHTSSTVNSPPVNTRSWNSIDEVLLAKRTRGDPGVDEADKENCEEGQSGVHVVCMTQTA